MSQGHVEKRAKSLNAKSEELKLTPVIDFDAAPLREKDWCNVLTCHQVLTVHGFGFSAPVTRCLFFSTLKPKHYTLTLTLNPEL